MRYLFALLTLAIPLTFFAQAPPIEPGVSQELAKWRAARYSDVRYKLSLTLEKMSPVLKGTIEIRVKISESVCTECPVEYIVLDWRKIAGHEKDSTVSNISLNGKSAAVVSPQAAIADGGVRVPVEERDEHLIFRDGVVGGENVIKLDFTSPILTSGSAITRYVDKEDGAEYIYSLFVPSDASTAFPVFDQPDLKAVFQLEMIAPPSWKIIGNAAQLDHGGVFEDKRQKITYRLTGFEPTKPISTYVFAFAAGDFSEFRGAEPSQETTLPDYSSGLDSRSVALSRISATNIYVRRSQAAKFQSHAAEVFRLTRKAVKYLETYFDYKFPFPKYDLVLIPEFPFGGMEHAGATFLRESAVIFPTEPTKGDAISRANLIFHETAHQWFGDTVTMRWFDDLWLKEGFAEFMAYKTLEKVMPDANAWKVFYERNKQAAYATDSTKGTTPIYQPIANLNSAKSAYGNIVYRKAPSFLRQAEFYLGEDKFQTAVRAFLKNHEFANAGWKDLAGQFEKATGKKLNDWAERWVLKPGMPTIRIDRLTRLDGLEGGYMLPQEAFEEELGLWNQRVQTLRVTADGKREILLDEPGHLGRDESRMNARRPRPVLYYFLNYGDYGYGIFLLDAKSRDYVLKNIGREKDPFLRSMMWGALWDSVREAELDPKDYVELAVTQLPTEQDETIASSILARVGTAMNYYLPEARRNTFAPRLEAVLLDRLQNAATAGQRITFYRAFGNNASTAKGREVLKQMLAQAARPTPSEIPTGSAAPTRGKIPAAVNAPRSAKSKNPVATAPGSDIRSAMPLRTKDKFDIVTRLIILGDPEAPKLLAELEKTEAGDDAKRYAYAAKAGFGTAENKAKFWNDFVNNKDISESWIEAAIGPFNSVRHAGLTQPYLERALAELPTLKRTRKIFFINNWLSAWIGGQRDEKALAIVTKFLADSPNLDRDLRLKILENIDLIDRAVRIRAKYGKT